MLREIIIVHNKKPILYKKFGNSFSWDKISYLIYLLEDLSVDSDKDIFNYLNLIKYRVFYYYNLKFKYLILLISDFTDRFADIKNGLNNFNIKLKELIQVKNDGNLIISDINVIYENLIEFFKELSPKIVFIGLGGVGKTAITKLIRAEDIPTKHIPTVTGNIIGIKIGNLTFTGWDLAGQEQFSFTWNKFIKKSDIILIVIDSSADISTIKRNKYFIDLIKRESPYSKVAVIANKQDKHNAKSPEIISKILNTLTFPLIAIDEYQRVKMLNYIGKIIEISDEVNALIEPMIMRDNLIQLAELTLKVTGNINKVPRIYEQIALLSEELGERDMAKYFNTKSQDISKSINKDLKKIIKKEQSDLIDIPDLTPKKPEFKKIKEKTEQIEVTISELNAVNFKIQNLKNKFRNDNKKSKDKNLQVAKDQIKSLNKEKIKLQEKIIELRMKKIQYLTI